MGNTDKGYIKVYRNVRDNWVWNDKPFNLGAAWIDLLMMVNHEDRKIIFNKSPLLVKRGSVVTSMRKLADRWGWHRNRVSRTLNALERDGMITQKRDSQCTTITIVNYGVYQHSGDSKRDSNAPRMQHPVKPPVQHKQYTKEDTKEDIKKETPYIPHDEEGEPWDEEGWMS